VKADKLTVEANSEYWGGKPDFDKLIVRSIPETAPRIAALLKGETDMITQLPPDQSSRITGNASTKVAGALYAGLYVLCVNSKRPPRSEEHTSELQSLTNLVCRLLLEKKKHRQQTHTT